MRRLQDTQHKKGFALRRVSLGVQPLLAAGWMRWRDSLGQSAGAPSRVFFGFLFAASHSAEFNNALMHAK